MTVSGIDRRRLLQLASLSIFAESLPLLAAQACTNANHDSSAEVKPYTVQFFSPEEIGLLDRAMEAILPADDHSPGAHGAQTSLFADLIVFNSPEDVRQDWRAGLRLLAAELESASLADWLHAASANEHSPQSSLDLFFIRLKQMTVEGYYTSRIGIHQDLQYQGNTYLKEFKGCTHAEHQTQTGNLRGLDCCDSNPVGSKPAA